MIDQEETLSTKDFTRLRSLIYERAGICLGSEKRIMLEGRLKRRLRALEIDSYSNYCEYLFSRDGLKREIVSLIDVVTTNKTDFFREPSHFSDLVDRVLPSLFPAGSGAQRFTVWSAGCSTGEEPYTLAIVLNEYAANHSGFSFRIWATDISTAVLAKAQLGVYTEDTVEPVPTPLRRKYFMRSRDRQTARVRVVPELRQAVEFRRLNFMDPDYRVHEKAGTVFCRNVLIYFDRPTQERILRKLCACLVPGGFLFVGHSESLHDMDLPIAPIAPALYRRIDDGT